MKFNVSKQSGLTNFPFTVKSVPNTATGGTDHIVCLATMVELVNIVKLCECSVIVTEGTITIMDEAG